MKTNIYTGLPGYGSKGKDGSIGLNGLSTFFYKSNVDSDTTYITECITNNKDFNNSANNIIGYPVRVYQTGDYIIDANVQTYEIDLSLPTKFIKIAELSITGFFELRSSNTWGTRVSPIISAQNKYTLDNVYTSSVNTANNYSTSTFQPTNIYNITPNNFAQINYADYIPNKYSNNLNIADYIPFFVYGAGTTGGSKENNSIALVKDKTKSLFRLGNLDENGNIRNTSLQLDFSTLTFNCNDVSILNNLNIDKTLNVYGNLVCKNGATLTYLNVQDDMIFTGTANFNGNTYFNNLYDETNQTVLLLGTNGLLYSTYIRTAFNTDFASNLECSTGTITTKSVNPQGLTSALEGDYERRYKWYGLTINSLITSPSVTSIIGYNYFMVSNYRKNYSADFGSAPFFYLNFDASINIQNDVSTLTFKYDTDANFLINTAQYFPIMSIQNNVITQFLIAKVYSSSINFVNIEIKGLNSGNISAGNYVFKLNNIIKLT